MTSIDTRSLKSYAQGNETKPYKVNKIFGKYVMALSNDLGITENTWYTQELQPNGDILLRKRIQKQ